MTDVMILGCGPAGLLAAHAAARAGLDFSILSEKVKSPMNGAQYLHEPIPEITDEPFRVNFKKVGSERGYALNTYGKPTAPVSWRKFPNGRRPAYALPSAYDRLWDLYGDSIEDQRVEPGDIAWITEEARFVISTIPRRNLCENPSCVFQAQKVFIAPYVEEGRPRVFNNEIVYNGLTGTNDPTWYRASRINGFDFTESRFPMEGAVPGWKPLFTTCTCHRELFYQGRFGSWSKNVLLHHVYTNVEKMVDRFVRHEGSLHALQ